MYSYLYLTTHSSSINFERFLIDFNSSFVIGLILKLFGRTTLAKSSCGLSTLNENRELAIYKVFKSKIYIVDVSHFQYRSSQRKINVPKLHPDMKFHCVVDNLITISNV